MFVPCVYSFHEVLRGVRYLGIGVLRGGESHYGCWEPNPGRLQEQQLSQTAEPSFQPLTSSFYHINMNIIFRNKKSLISYILTLLFINKSHFYNNHITSNKIFFALEK